jgi:tryptophan synthase alpha chain
MVSFSVAFRYGVEKFVATAKEAGFDGLILPDLPPPEAERICDKVRAAGLDTILLVAPTTSIDRSALRGVTTIEACVWCTPLVAVTMYVPGSSAKNPPSASTVAPSPSTAQFTE